MTAHLVLLGAIAWGALAFGAVYPWAYWPLAVLCALSGVLGVVVARRSKTAGTSRALRLALIATAAAILVQVVPVPHGLAALCSPRAGALVRQLNPAFAAGLEPFHPISVWPRDTWTAFALYASLALLLVGGMHLFSVTGARRFVEALTGFAAILALIGFVQ